MTLALMERYIQSEVENLHFRLDDVTAFVERIDERLSTVERQLHLLNLAVEDIKVDIAYMKENFVTRDYVDIIITTAVDAAKDELKDYIAAQFTSLLQKLAPQ